MKQFQVSSFWIPDTVVHPLNGSYAVDIGRMADWLRGNIGWLSPDEADQFANALKQAATRARNHVQEVSDGLVRQDATGGA